MRVEQRDVGFSEERAIERGSLEVDGCLIDWAAWGSRDQSAIVVLHGALAHRHWWTPVIDHLWNRGRVVALDLSGHGDSGHREAYSASQWADEVLAAIEHCTVGHAAIAGHSMGGLVALVAAARRPELVTSLLILDSNIRIPTPDAGGVPRGSPPKQLRDFGSNEEAIEAFRLLPRQPIVNPEAVKYAAERSATRFGDGWRWKFDPRVAQRFTDDLINAHLSLVECPVRMIYGACSALSSAANVADMGLILGRPVAAEVIPAAYHHLILDRPTETAAALERAWVQQR